MNKFIINFLFIILLILVTFFVIHCFDKKFNIRAKHMASINKFKINSQFTTLNGNKL